MKNKAFHIFFMSPIIAALTIMNSLCIKPIFNIICYSWNKTGSNELLSSLFGNNCIQSEEYNNDNRCCSIATVINNDDVDMKELKHDIFDKMFTNSSHINLTVLHNENYKSQTYINYLNLATQNIVIFNISINSNNMSEELNALEFICDQISNTDTQTKLCILIDGCTTLQYNEDTGVVNFILNNSKEETLYAMLVNIIKNKISKYKVPLDFFKISLQRSAVYNNFTPDLTNMTNSQIDYLGNVFLGDFTWNSTPIELKRAKLQERTKNLSVDEFNLHVQSICNTGFIVFSEFIKKILSNLNSNNCAIEKFKKIVRDLKKCIKINLGNTYTFSSLTQILFDNREGLRELDSIAAILSDCEKIKGILTDLFTTNNLNEIPMQNITYDDTNISFLCYSIHEFNNFKNLNKLTNNLLLNFIKDTIKEIINNFKPISGQGLQEWFKLLSELSKVMNNDEIINKIPLLVYEDYVKICSCKTTDPNLPHYCAQNFLLTAQKLSSQYKFNDKLFYCFVARQTMLVYKEIMLKNLHTPHLTFDSSLNVITLLIRHKISKFWNNSLLSHMVDHDPILSNINIVASECYRHCPVGAIDFTEIMENNITADCVYNLALEEYLINNKN
jgi:hypothetical protein